MCTAVTLQSLQMEFFLGRTMDFSYVIDPELWVIPKGYVWGNGALAGKHANQYSFIGIGQKEEESHFFADGVNEQGFAVAALYFEGYAHYGEPVKNAKKPEVAAVDLVHYLLGRCASVGEVKRALQGISLTGVEDKVTNSVAPLHWIAADRNRGCVVIESTRQGVQIFQNTIGVLANSPDFSWQMTNLRNYIGVTQGQPSQASWGDVPLKPFGQGAGTSLLPGGYTSPERFARTAFLKSHICVPKTRAEAIAACFHLLNSVTIPKGAVITARNTYDYTKYTAFINTNTREYYFKTYNNPNITVASLSRHQGYLQPVCLGKINRPLVLAKID